jgi:hypothetical protein
MGFAEATKALRWQQNGGDNLAIRAICLKVVKSTWFCAVMCYEVDQRLAEAVKH